MNSRKPNNSLGLRVFQLSNFWKKLWKNVIELEKAKKLTWSKRFSTFKFLKLFLKNRQWTRKSQKNRLVLNVFQLSNFWNFFWKTFNELEKAKKKLTCSKHSSTCQFLKIHLKNRHWTRESQKNSLGLSVFQLSNFWKLFRKTVNELEKAKKNWLGLIVFQLSNFWKLFRKTVNELEKAKTIDFSKRFSTFQFLNFFWKNRQWTRESQKNWLFLNVFQLSNFWIFFLKNRQWTRKSQKKIDLFWRFFNLPIFFWKFIWKTVIELEKAKKTYLVYAFFNFQFFESYFPKTVNEIEKAKKKNWLVLNILRLANFWKKNLFKAKFFLRNSSMDTFSQKILRKTRQQVNET